MVQTKGYYNNLFTNISFSDNEIKIGTIKIKTGDIYQIKVNYLTGYGKLFQVGFIAFAMVLSILLGLLFFPNVFITVTIAIGLITSVYTYYFYPKILIKRAKDDYIKTIDIFYNDLHTALLVPGSFEFNPKDYVKKKLTHHQKNVINKYMHRVKSSRKYLMTQIESKGHLTPEILQEKYVVVATRRYVIESNFGVKAVKAIKESYQDIAGKEIRFAIKSARFTIVVFIAIIIYLALYGNMELKPFMF